MSISETHAHEWLGRRRQLVGQGGKVIGAKRSRDEIPAVFKSLKCPPRLDRDIFASPPGTSCV